MSAPPPATVPAVQSVASASEPGGEQAGERATSWVSRFYLRLGAGAGVFIGPENSYFSFCTGIVCGGGVSSAVVVALSIPGELAVGSRVTPTLTLGGGLYADGVVLLRSYPYARLVSVVGPLLDYYFQPGSGPHVQAMAGLGSTISEGVAAYPGLGGGFGYDWIATPSWNIGILARSLVLVSQTPTFTPGLLLTATMR